MKRKNRSLKDWHRRWRAFLFVSLMVLGSFLLSGLSPGSTASARTESPAPGRALALAAASPQQAASTTWYFAEGSVGNSFQEYITMFNPNTTAVTVTMTYLFQNTSPRVFTHTVNASSRATVNVNTELQVAVTAPQQATSVILTSTQPIVAERPMYFVYNGVASGTDVVGATNANSTIYYFAEGEGGPGYSTFVSLLNPSQTNTAHITLRYYSGGGVLKVQTLTIAPMHRGTSSPGGFSTRKQVSIQVESDIGIGAERPMYVNVTMPIAGGATTGAASAVGATGPGGDWLFAEGYTGTNFQEYLVIANVTSNTAKVQVKLEYTNGTTQTVPITVSALSQVNFDVNNAFAHPQPGSSPTGSVSAEVTSTPPSIVVERVMYFHFGPKLVSGVTDVVGEAGPASHTLYNFAEGYASTTFDEFLTLQNPTGNAETVTISLYTTQPAKQVTRVLQPYSRSTESINGLLSNPGSLSVSVSVQSTSGPIVAERPMYFTYGSSKGGTDVHGFTGDPSPPPCSGGTPVSAVEIARGNTSRHQIALTFDAGGENAPAASILGTLNARGIHATWFFTGEWAQQNPVVTQNVAAGGYLIGNHTMTHPSLTTIPTIDICRQLNQANQTITALTGRSTTRPYYRPPYGARDQRVWDVTASMGYRTVYWTLDTLDWETTSTKESILTKIQDSLNSDPYSGNGAIILMHAGSSSEAQALNSVIDLLQGKGFQFGTINEILQ